MVAQVAFRDRPLLALCLNLFRSVVFVCPRPVPLIYNDNHLHILLAFKTKCGINDQANFTLKLNVLV